MEFRIKDCQLQAQENGKLKVGGYINVTERESEMLFNKKNGKWFKEVMKKGVFQRAIDKSKGIPLLFEHNWNKKLASTEEGSLVLKEDNVGLKFEAVIEDADIYDQVKAGVINSCSFGFRALAEEVESINTRLEKRLVNAIELMEVSLVKNPAYVGSLVELRSYEEELKEERACEEEERVDNLEQEIEEEKLEAEIEGETEEEVALEIQEEVIESQEESLVEEEKVEARVDEAYLTELVEKLIEAKLQKINGEEVVNEDESLEAREKEVEEVPAEETEVEEVTETEAEETEEVTETEESVEEQPQDTRNLQVANLKLQILKLK